MVCRTVRLPYYRMLLQLPNTVLKLTMPPAVYILGWSYFPLCPQRNAATRNKYNHVFFSFCCSVLFCLFS